MEKCLHALPQAEISDEGMFEQYSWPFLSSFLMTDIWQYIYTKK